MGVLAPGSAHARPSARPPINTSGNFPAHVSVESPSNISPNPSEVISEVSEPKDNFWNFQQKKLKMPPEGAREWGFSEFFGGLISPFLERINPLWSFRTLTDLFLIFQKNKIAPQEARGWGSEFYFFPIIFIIFLDAHAKIWNPTTTPFGVLNNGINKIRRTRKD